MKKLLILGAMEMHIPLIERAKELGFYTITCDYIPEAPGHKIADEYHYDSTTDLNAVLQLAEKLQIDAIMTYNSDPAAPTAAYVAEKLHLPGNPYTAVKIMSEKDLFRGFLREKGLNHPKFFPYDKNLDQIPDIPEDCYPLIVKPVDSSGSKGCTVIKERTALPEALAVALKKSRCGRCIIEEYIEPQGRQLHGDGFAENGKVTFLCLGDHYFDEKINNLVPYSTAYPTQHKPEVFKACLDELQRFITKVGFQNGGFNVELRVSRKNMKPYIIDIGARNGGNFTPKIIEYATGFNFLDAVLAVAGGMNIPEQKIENKGFFSYLILHSRQKGVLKNILLNNEIESRILEKHIYSHPGDEVDVFTRANTALGVLLMKYESREMMKYIVENFENLYTVEVDTI